MLCPHCNQKIPNGSILCPKCGKSIQQSSGKKRLPILICVIVIVITAAGSSIFFWLNQPKEKSYQELLNSAEHYLIELDYEQAETLYLEAIEIEPSELEAYLSLYELYVNNNEVEKAMSLLEKAKEYIAGKDDIEKIDIKLAELGKKEEDAPIDKDPVVTYLDPTSQDFENLNIQFNNIDMPELLYNYEKPQESYIDDESDNQKTFYESVSSGLLVDPITWSRGSLVNKMVEFENDPDPLNKFEDSYVKGEYTYSVIDGEKMDWIIKNQFACEPDHTLNSEICYYYDGNYYTYYVAELAPYVGHKLVVDRYEKLDNGMYVMDCSFYNGMDETMLVSKRKITAGLRDIEGERYWTLYKVERI